MARIVWPALPPVLEASDISSLGDVTLQGDIRSYAWDGGGSLAGGADATATAGFLLDSSAGNAQFQNLFAKGGDFENVTISGVITAGAGSDVDWSYISNVSIVNADIVSLTFDKITAATNTASLVVGGAGTVGSANYSAGTAGWQIEGDGSAEFNDVTVRGTLGANLITGDLTLSGGSFKTAASGQRIEIDASNFIEFYSGHADETDAGYILADDGVIAAGDIGKLHIVSPAMNSQSTVSIRMTSEVDAGASNASEDTTLLLNAQTVEIGPLSGAASWASVILNNRVEFTSNGSASAPTITVGGSGNGIYRVGTDNIGFATGGTLRFNINSSGVLDANGHYIDDLTWVRSDSYVAHGDTDTFIDFPAADTLDFTVGNRHFLRLDEDTEDHILIPMEVQLEFRDGSYTDSGRRYRMYMDDSDFDTLKLDVSDSGSSWALGLGFVDANVNSHLIRDNTTGSAANMVVDATTGLIQRSTSARKYKSRVTYNTRHLADIDLSPAKFYRKDSAAWFYGFIAEDFGDQDRLLATYREDGEIEDYDQGALLAVLAAKVNRLEERVYG